ncbi:GlmU family protein [Cytophagaceae bacterium YF14B1]|uniref:GlmU family protein n=1 Tax=Xanthocytophaga flava TaxID=3048013 RepID=A0AAE3QQ39_9BACT|nr:GlmU family protein [Xanthocytophaga flavus]MDJ1483412.1 GlmU family protein [Xanthocytophaga flavus]
MNYILFDDPLVHGALLPLTFTRPISHIRLGIVTIAEKWLHFLQGGISYLTEDFLQKKYISVWDEDNLLINGSLCPDQNLVKAIGKLAHGESLQCGNVLIALRIPYTLKDSKDIIAAAGNTTVHPYTGTLTQVRQLSDIFLLNGSQIRADYAWLTEGRISREITDPHTIMYNPSHIFLEEGAKTKACILNAENGPIYIGKDADIQEGSIIRGPFAIGESSIVALGAKMRGEITIGPHCKIGGEVSNSILFGFSNKGHDGYLGNSILGEWCNLGADTNTSNLKNDYGIVKQWSYVENDFMDTGRQFVGLVMGDHSKAGINTMFNTGTVVGVSANIFGGNFPPKHVPSFTWGGAEGLDIYRLDRALDVAQRVLERKALQLTPEDREILTYVFYATHEK